MRIKLIVLIIIITFTFLKTSPECFAQEKIVLTVEKSVAMALEKNPDLKIAEKEYAKARASVVESYSALLPTINASANLQHSWDIQENTIPNFIKQMLGPDFPGASDMPDFVRLSFGLENSLTYGANLTQPLFLGGAGIAGVKMAYAAQKASKHQMELRKQNLIYQTTDAFYGSLLARELVGVQEEAMHQAQANLDVVLKKYDVGTASGFDKMRAEVEVANLKPEVIAARNNYQAALTGLRTVLALPKETKIEVEGLLEYNHDDLGTISLDELLKLAFKSRPELFAIDAQKSIVSKGVTLARSQFLPKLFFTTNYSFLAMRNDYNFRGDDFSKGFTSAISLQVPLFTGFKNLKQHQKATLDYKIIIDSEKQIYDGVTAEVELAYNKFKESDQKFYAAKESISLAEEALRLANLLYEEGASTQLDVLNSQLALTRSRLNFVSALYEYQMARYGLRKVTGTLKDII